jgi:type I restriction enzyme, S subunit
MSWPQVKFEEVALQAKGSIVSGPFGSNIGSRFFVDDGVPVIRGNNLTFGQRRFVDDGFVFLTEEKAEEFKNCQAVEGDLVFTAAGTIGQVGIIPTGTRFDRYIISNKQLRVRCDKSKVNPLFLFLWFTTAGMRQHIINKNSGSTIPLINLGILRGLPVPLPPLETQTRIADLVSSYDDLIENNRRRMALLEDSARLLYREWFVRLRFPGYEHTRIVDGVPQGWERKTMGNLCSEIRDLVLPEALEPDTPYIGLEHIPRRSISLNEWGTAEQVTSSKSRFKAGEILFGKIRPYFHKVGAAFVDGVASSDAIVIRPADEKLHALVLMTMSSDEFVAVTAQQMKEGSKMPRADWKQMQAYSVPVPPAGLLNSFDGTIQPVIAQLKSLSFANQKLRAARDLLLPRLMSGELSA